MSFKIPLHTTFLKGNEKKYLMECIDDNFVSSSGRFVDKFEKRFSNFVKAKYAVACSSGTAALHLALEVAGVKKDDLVIVSSLTFIATVNVIKYVGAKPVFIDSNERTAQIEPSNIEKFLKKECAFDGKLCFHKKSKRRIAAILPAHILGHAAEINKIVSISKKYKIKVIEDAAEAVGVKVKGKYAGTFGLVGCYSFNGNKIITSGGGGMVVTNNLKIAEKAKFLSIQAKNKGFEYIHKEVGFNYRMSNIQAAVGLGQLESINKLIKEKIRIAKIYIKNFKNIPEISWISPDEFTESTWWLFTILIDKKKKRSSRGLLKFLQSFYIESRPLWQPIHMSKPYKTKTNCINSELFYKNSLSLPSYVGLKKIEQELIVKKILQYFHN